MSRLQELQERRAYECRLTPDRALRSLDEAEEFLRDRGLLTRTPDCALPSLYEACHEDPYRPGTGGFGSWPATKWPWAGELAERDGITMLKIHRGKSVLVTEEVVRLLDPICRDELARMERDDPDWARLLDHLAAAGPSEPEDLQLELGLKPKELKQLRYPLELCGAVVSRQVVHAAGGGGHVHASVLERWDQLFPEPADGPAGLGELLVAGVRAAVVAPERELGRWFPWRWHFSPQLVDDLVAEGRLERPEPGWVATP
jgi:hypothetical protein